MATPGRSHELTVARQSGNRTASWWLEPTSHEKLLSLSLSVPACVCARRASGSFRGTLSTCVALNRCFKGQNYCVVSLLRINTWFVSGDQHCSTGVSRQTVVKWSHAVTWPGRHQVTVVVLSSATTQPLFTSSVIAHLSLTPLPHPHCQAPPTPSPQLVLSLLLLSPGRKLK